MGIIIKDGVQYGGSPNMITASEIVYDDTATELSVDNVQGAIIALRELIYPVGSIYMSTLDTNPSTVWGGTWEQIKDTFLLSAGSTYEAGSTGGEATHTLTSDEMPSHTHTFSGSAVTSGNNSVGHTHSFTSGNPSANHTHSIPALSGTAASAGSHSHEFYTMGDITYPTGNGSATYSRVVINQNWGYNLSTTSAGSHTHSVTTSSNTSGTVSAWHTHSGTTGGISANHTHSVTASGTNSNTGGGSAMNNMPPYLAVYVWKRTA